jgi:hypothetical protein
LSLELNHYIKKSLFDGITYLITLPENKPLITTKIMNSVLSTYVNNKIFDHFINHISKSKDILQFYDELGLVPNDQTYNFILKQYFENNDYNNGFEFIKIMKTKNMYNIYTRSIIIQFMLKYDKLNKAIDMYNEIKSTEKPNRQCYHIIMEYLVEKLDHSVSSSLNKELVSTFNYIIMDFMELKISLDVKFLKTLIQFLLKNDSLHTSSVIISLFKNRDNERNFFLRYYLNALIKRNVNVQVNLNRIYNFLEKYNIPIGIEVYDIFLNYYVTNKFYKKSIKIVEKLISIDLKPSIKTYGTFTKKNIPSDLSK